MNRPCGRTDRHPAHSYVPDAFSSVDEQCPGLPQARPLAALVADRPDVLGVGVATQVLALEVMSA